MDYRDMASDIRKARQWFIESEREETGSRPYAEMIVCPACNGKGKYVNPGVDSHGLTGEDFEDPDFEEAYFNGTYDVTCEECNGRNVVEEFVDPEVRDRWAEWQADVYSDHRTRMGEMGIY